MLANDDVTEDDKGRLVRAGGRYGKVTRGWRATADGKPAIVGICSQVGIVISDDDTVRLAYKKLNTRVTASGSTRALATASTSTSVDFADEAAAQAFDAAWTGSGTGMSSLQSWREGLAFLSGLLLFLAAVVLVAGVGDAVVLFSHSRKGLVSNGYGGSEVGRVHPQTAVAFAVLVGSLVSAAVLAWCGVVGHYLLQRLEPAENAH